MSLLLEREKEREGEEIMLTHIQSVGNRICFWSKFSNVGTIIIVYRKLNSELNFQNFRRRVCASAKSLKILKIRHDGDFIQVIE